MTLLHKNVGKRYLITDDEDDSSRPQLISRHSSSLPIDHRNETKILSRRSRSASPCIKKTHLISGNTAEKRKIAKEASTNSQQRPVIKKQASQTLGKNNRAPRNNLSNTNKRVQVLNDHRKLKIPNRVWEHICTQGAVVFKDINSNVSYDEPVRCSYVRELTALSQFEENYCGGRYQKVRTVPFKTTIDALPAECMLTIFSYLNQMDRGRCMFVSKQWRCWVRSPQLWRNVNLREFVLCYEHARLEPEDYLLDEDDLSSLALRCNKRCYGRYMNRMDRYILFLIDIETRVRRVAISFDLANDDWMATVRNLFRHVNFSELTFADIDWHVTPAKPTWLTGSPAFRFKDVSYAARRRQRYFLDFLDEFVPELPSLRSLIVPFGWSLREIKSLGMLPRLTCLVLKSYTVFCNLQQEALDELANMAGLEKLLIEVWMSMMTANKYTLSSPSLKYLDLSQCKGFYLQRVDLPSLEVLKVERYVEPGQRPSVVLCLYDILRSGAPKLKRINDVTLDSTDSIDSIFNRICPCSKHMY